jgi:hypothetical protein
VATKAGEPISIDVLANDTDPDGDALVFQILKTTGGDASVDDGGTPTDASDDRVLFSPADPAPASAEINYQAVDPRGAVASAVVSVSINAQGSLPEGVHSEAVAESGSGTCGGLAAAATTTTSTDESATVSSSPPYTGSFTVTTVGAHKAPAKKKPSGGHTTTTRKPSSSTTRAPGTTQPHTTTTHEPNSTTTQPSGPPPTTDPSCGAFPSDGTKAEQDAWKQCVKDHSGHP